MTETENNYKLAADLRQLGATGFMSPDSRTHVPYGLLYRACDTIRALMAERDALRAQLDNMTTEWGVGRAIEYGPYWRSDTEGEDKARFVAENSDGIVIKRLVGPWVDVTD